MTTWNLVPGGGCMERMLGQCANGLNGKLRPETSTVPPFSGSCRINASSARISVLWRFWFISIQSLLANDALDKAGLEIAAMTTTAANILVFAPFMETAAISTTGAYRR